MDFGDFALRIFRVTLDVIVVYNTLRMCSSFPSLACHCKVDVSQLGRGARIGSRCETQGASSVPAHTCQGALRRCRTALHPILVTDARGIRRQPATAQRSRANECRGSFTSSSERTTQPSFCRGIRVACARASSRSSHSCSSLPAEHVRHRQISF